ALPSVERRQRSSSHWAGRPVSRSTRPRCSWPRWSACIDNCSNASRCAGGPGDEWAGGGPPPLRRRSASACEAMAVKPGGARGRFARVAGSLASAWKPGPTGRRWAPWAWTLVVNTLIAAILAVAVPKGGGFARYLLISQAIGLTIHALFWTIGHRLRFDMFEVSLPVRLVYVASVALAGSWLGYAAAWALILGDWPSLVEHMTRASRWLIAMPIAWAFATIALLALLSRVRGRQ